MVEDQLNSHHLPVRAQLIRNEGLQGFLLRLAEANLMTVKQVQLMDIGTDINSLLEHGLIQVETIDPQLFQHAARLFHLWQKKERVWNMRYGRFCPICLLANGHWQAEWELNFYDVCHHHGTWLVDQCTSCKQKVTWQRERLLYCKCGSKLTSEQPSKCPENLQKVANIIHTKLYAEDAASLPTILEKTDLEQTQRLIRYLGNYMTTASGKNPLKMLHAQDLNQSWPVTALAAEIINQWPTAFHQALNKIERSNQSMNRPSLNNVFGHAYHYAFKALKEKPFKPFRTEFEKWINNAWKGGVAKRNKRLTSTLLSHASWIPGNLACEKLGISQQRLNLLIREGTIEGEVYYSKTGRKYVMVRRDNLENTKTHLFNFIDMTTVGRLLGIHKRRLRQLVTLLFMDAKKLSNSPGATWQISRLEVNQLLDLGEGLPTVSIADEGCVSLGHVLKYWTWSNGEIAALIFCVSKKEIAIMHVLDSATGIAAWCFNEQVLKHWKLKNQQGLGQWLTIDEAAKAIGIKQQVAYELVSFGFMKSEVMPNQNKRGTRIKREVLEGFKSQYIFATEIAQQLGVSPRKAIAHINAFGISQISGPQVNGGKQVMYLRNEEMGLFITEALG